MLSRTSSREFEFSYDQDYLLDPAAPAVSRTLKKRREVYRSPHLFPFFAGLLAEGFLKTLQCRRLNIDEDDAFTRLVKTAGMDVPGQVTVHEELIPS